ncbi:MAG: hypothetical protein ACR2PX_06115 [Endozoicomonas sp.]|uniref:hypothetical protein n=1 Tax=Endozoicomonas sp. TaxID=1892382 RepID=UPI003D9BF9FE
MNTALADYKEGDEGQMIGLYATWDDQKKTYVLSDDQQAYLVIPEVNPISTGASAIRLRAMPTRETLLIDVCLHATTLDCEQYKLDKTSSDKAYRTTGSDSEGYSFQGPEFALVNSWANISHPFMYYIGKKNGSVFVLPLSAFKNKFPTGSPVFVNQEDSRMAALDKSYDCEVTVRNFGSKGQYAFRHCQTQTVNSWVSFKPVDQTTGYQEDIVSFLKQRGVADAMTNASNIQVKDIFMDGNYSAPPAGNGWC